MKNLISLDIKDKVLGATTNNDSWANRLRIIFKNSYELSIINGSGAYADEKTFEIAVFHNGNFITRDIWQQMFNEDSYDDVVGYQTEDEVKNVAVFVANLPAKDIL